MPQTLFIIYSTNIPWTTASVQFSSVTQLCLTLCDPMKCRMPSLPVHWRWSWLVHSNPHPLNQWCHPTISSSVVPFSSCPQSSPASGSFPVSQLFTSDGQSIGASASVLPMNIQHWFPLGLTDLISLQSKELKKFSKCYYKIQWSWYIHRTVPPLPLS